MDTTRNGTDGVARLQVVQDRVRSLARNHEWFGDAIRDALFGYIALCVRFGREKEAMRQQERQLARDLLAKGWLRDPSAGDYTHCTFVSVHGLCPISLHARLAEYGWNPIMPRELEQENAAAALAAMDREDEYNTRDLPEARKNAMDAEYSAALEAKTHGPYQWRVLVSLPPDRKEPASPYGLDPDNLSQFTEAEYRTIALYWLGGLADTGSPRRFVPKPADTGDLGRDMTAIELWSDRFPIVGSDHNDVHAALSTQKLPPSIAEQMFEDILTWVRGEEKRRSDAPAMGSEETVTVPTANSANPQEQSVERVSVPVTAAPTLPVEAHDVAAELSEFHEQDFQAIGRDLGLAPTPATTTSADSIADEKLLPSWLQVSGLPSRFIGPLEETYLQFKDADRVKHLLAMLHFSEMAGYGFLGVRRDHEAKPDAMEPKVFARNVVFMMRFARDEILVDTEPGRTQLFADRLNALIDATEASFNSLMAEPLDRILCDNPTCPRRGKHLLNGPWGVIVERKREAFTDLVRLSTVLSDKPTTNVSVPIRLIEELRQTMDATEQAVRDFGAHHGGGARALEAPAMVALTSDHESALAILGKNPNKCKRVVDMLEKGPIRNRETMGRLLRELESFGLVDRPFGPRKGYRLTGKGLQHRSDISPT
jgi:hypothetical protein